MTTPTPRSAAAFAFQGPEMNMSLPILSPCIGICRLGSDGWCEGCLRSGDEIARWVAMGETERRRLMEEVLPRRQAALE